MTASSPAFQAALPPLAEGGRAEAVVQRIGEAVTLGVLVDGDQLPSENDLALQLGVAVGTIREALASLREEGVIETRRGRGGGSFVRASDDRIAHLHLQRLKTASMAKLRDIGDEKAAVSGTAARLAAERADPDLGRRLKARLAALRNASTVAECRRAESRFHIEIAMASQSVRLSHAEVRLQAELGPLVWLPDYAPDADEVAEQLDAVMVAVVSGDGHEARTRIEQHVLSGIRCAVAAHLSTVEPPTARREPGARHE